MAMAVGVIQSSENLVYTHRMMFNQRLSDVPYQRGNFQLVRSSPSPETPTKPLEWSHGCCLTGAVFQVPSFRCRIIVQYDDGLQPYSQAQAPCSETRLHLFGVLYRSTPPSAPVTNDNLL